MAELIYSKIFNNIGKHLKEYWTRLTLYFLDVFFTEVQLYGFLLLVLLPSTMSTPLRGKRSSTDKLTRSDEKTSWGNPCAGASTEAKYENNGTENMFFSSVIQSGELAIYFAKQFVEQYVSRKFHLLLIGDGTYENTGFCNLVQIRWRQNWNCLTYVLKYKPPLLTIGDRFINFLPQALNSMSHLDM